MRLPLAGHRICRHGATRLSTGRYRPSWDEAWFARERRRAPSRRSAFERISGGPLQPDLRRERRRRASLGAAAPAARQAARVRARHGPGAPDHRRARGAPTCRCRRSSASARTSRSTARPSTSWSSWTARSCARRPRPRRASTRPSAARSASASSTRWSRSTRSTPTQVGLGELGRKEDYVARQLRRWHGQWEKSKTRELPMVDDVHDRLVRADPRAGPGDDRPRRLPPGQHDPVARRRGRGRRRLGALHARRSARRRRPAARLLVGAGRRVHAALRGADDGRRASRPASERRRALRRALRARPLRDRLLRRARPTGSSRSSSRASTPATPRASTARPTRASRSSRRSSSGSPRAPTRRRAPDAWARPWPARRARLRLGPGAVGAGLGLASAQRLSSRRAMTILWTSSGPSAIRSMRLKRHIQASGVSSDIPSEPWTWIARSSTSMTTLAATTLIIEISRRASRLPPCPSSRRRRGSAAGPGRSPSATWR